ncbi:MAG: NAD-dependent epimerase/dehydratase family protein [Halobacteriaceae archaeon]
MQKVLITGSEGFIGKRLQSFLRSEQDCEVWTLDTEDSTGNHFACPVQDFDRFDEFDTIYHLAAVTDRSLSKSKLWDVNVEGTRNVCKHVGGGQKVVFTSSAYIYNQDKKGVKKEGEREEPENYYGLTKLISEKLISYFARENGFEYSLFRLFFVYGPSQPEGFLIPDLVSRAATEDLEVNQPQSYLSLAYIEDVIEILTDSQVQGGPFNICEGCYSMETIYDTVARLMGVDVEVADEASANRTYLCGDNTKISDYKESWTALEEGVAEVILKKTNNPFKDNERVA